MLTFNHVPDDLPDDFPLTIKAHANDPAPLATTMQAYRLAHLLRALARDPETARDFIALTASLDDRWAVMTLDLFRMVEALMVEGGEIAGVTAL